MKHLILLSLKYIKRQKLRSLLTFLCITLSIFILGVCCSFFSSVITTMTNEEIKNQGSWEVKLASLVQTCDEPAKNKSNCKSSREAAMIASNHPVVKDYYYVGYNNSEGDIFRNENDSEIIYFDVQFDNGMKKKYSEIMQRFSSGSIELAGSNFALSFDGEFEFKNSNGIVLPYEFSEYGYKVGDEITMQITPARGTIDTSCKAVTDSIAYAEEYNKGNEMAFFINDGDELPVTDDDFDGIVVHEYPLTVLMSRFGYPLSDAEFVNEKRGTSLSYTFVIEKFADKIESPHYTNTNTLELQLPVSSSFSLDNLYSENPDILPPRENNFISSYSNLYLTIADNADFDDAVTKFYLDLGFPEEEFYSHINPEEDYHTDLLALEMKSADAISSLLPLILIGLFIAFIAWAIARFVIDNAFEISVRERSAQFASLRTMGASKNQLLALVFTEATFYCITALPVGLVLSALLCKSAITTIKNAGFPTFEFSLRPVFIIICVILCLLAIYISAYTSAIWASRKLTLKDALNYGKPNTNNKSVKARKSVARRNSKGFIVGYTFRNIFRTKSRFVISTIAMALGVLMFSYCSMLGIYISGMVKREIDYVDPSDFQFYSSYYENVKYAEKTFSNNKLFSSFRIEFDTSYIPSSDSDTDMLKKILPDDYTGKNTELDYTLYAIDRYTYENYIESYTNISYDEFIASEGALLPTSPYGLDYEVDKNGMPLKKYDKGFTHYSEFSMNEMPEITLEQRYSFESFDINEAIPPVKIKLLGTLCSDISAAKIIMPIENLDKIFSDGEKQIEYFTVRLTVKDYKSYEAASNEINNWTKNQSDGSSSVLGYEDNFSTNTGRNEFIKAIVQILLIFLLSVWLTGVFSMMNSINTSVLNRRPELLMMRAVGMSKKQLLRTVVIESILFSSAATIVGLTLGTGSFILTIMLAFKGSYTSMITSMIIVMAATLLLNVIISVLASLPGIKTLSKTMKQQNM